MKNNSKTKINSKKQLIVKKNYYDKAIIVLIITMIVLVCLIVPRELKMRKGGNDVDYILSVFEVLDNVEGPETEETELAQNEIPLKIGGHKVVGVIKIPSIGIEYPILNETTDESLWVSITKLSGPKLNSYGNVSLAGHNARNGKLFGRLSMVNVDDIIEITSVDKKTIKYQVYDVYSVEPENVSPTETKDDKIREVTLISCIANGKKRLIVKAKEVL